MDNFSFENKITNVDTTTNNSYLAQKDPKSQICIISTNNTNDIMNTAKNTLRNYDICHYIKTKCGIQELLKGIKSKVMNYTMRDYCIILIGEEDFRTTDNYFNLIYNIRSALQEIDNTNIIIGLPTFKFNNRSMMFNSRIENFNNLLYLDIMTHFHAYLLDSNLHLTYDATMFDEWTGKINNYGIKTIFDDLKQLIEEIAGIPRIEDYKDYENSKNVKGVDSKQINNSKVSNENIHTASNFFLV